MPPASSSSSLARWVATACVALALGACDDERARPTPTQPDPPGTSLPLVWPLAGVDDPDADSVHSPYGPRWIGTYDFHAGVDLPAPLGTQVRAVLPGRVAQVRTWDGTSTGAGNAVLIHHSDGRSTSYLHLHTSQVQAGDRVEAGQVIGAVGRTGATYPHLHLGYMMDLPGNSVDERRSRNPLELLPHTPSTLPSASYPDSFTVELEVPLQSMTLRTLELHGGGERRVLDYYAVVALGSAPRNAETHGGIRVEVAPAHDGRFPLTLQVASPRFLVERVVAIDINGDTLMDSSRPE